MKDQKENNADLFSQPPLLIFIKGANISGGYCMFRYDQFQGACCWERKKNPQNSISLLSVFVFPTLQFFTIISALITEPSCHFSNTIHN